MQAVRYHEHGDPDVFQVDEVPRPSPAADEVLVEMRAASVNPVDLLVRSGLYGDVSLPSVPGGDGAGVVAAAGEGVETVLDHRLEEYLDLDLGVLAEGGQVVSLMGNVPEASALLFYAKEVTLRALRMDNHPVRTPMLERVLRLVERGDLTPVVANTYGFDEVGRSHRALSEGGYVGKLVVTP